MLSYICTIRFNNNENMKIENTIAQMRKGILELCVLSIIAKKEAYPSDIIKELKKSKLIVVEGTLYPLLNRLKNSKLLDYNWKESTSGPPRKYYTITEDGEAFKSQLKDTWEELNHAIQASGKKAKATSK